MITFCYTLSLCFRSGELTHISQHYIDSQLQQAGTRRHFLLQLGSTSNVLMLTTGKYHHTIPYE